MRTFIKCLTIYLVALGMIHANLPPTTLKGQSESGKTTTFNTQVPYNQATTLSNGTRLIETGNPNFLANPSFEAPTLVGWTCSTGTCTRTTVSGEFSHGSAAVKIVPASNTFSFRQNVSVPLGVVRQGYLRFNYKIPSTCPIRLSVQADSNTSEVPNIVNGMILDNTWRTYEVPILIGPNVSAIELFKDGGGCTASEIFFDNFIVASGLGLTNLQLSPESISYGGYLSKSGSSIRFKTLLDSNASLLLAVDNSSFTKYTALKKVMATVCFSSWFSSARSDSVVSLYNSSGTVKKSWEGFYTQSGSTGSANGVCATSAMEIGDYFVASQSTATPTDSTSATTFTITAQSTDGASVYSAASNPALVTDVFSAKVSSAGVVTGENTDWINGSCSTSTGTQNFATTCNFASNIFTVAPNCLVSLNKEYDWTGGIQSVTSSSVSYTVSSAGSGSAGADVYLICQKQGADFTNSVKPYIVGSFQGYNYTPNVDSPRLYSFTASTTGVVSQEKGDIINGNGVVTDSSLFTYTLNSNVFTQAPNCSIGVVSGDVTVNIAARIVSTSTSSIVIRTGASDTGTSFAKIAYGHNVICHGN